MNNCILLSAEEREALLLHCGAILRLIGTTDAELKKFILNF